jgi:hypothetical protein
MAGVQEQEQRIHHRRAISCPVEVKAKFNVFSVFLKLSQLQRAGKPL